VSRSNAVVEASGDTFGSVTGDHTGSHGSSFLFQRRSASASSCLFYLFPTALVAMMYGSVLSMVCATFATVVAAFLLYDPIYSLYVSDSRDVGELILFAVTGLIGAKCTAELTRSPEKPL
jgi:K+-sensing histidine kinase KdpD